jgi:thioredoxin-like negative regulator of GroEL
LLTIVVYLLSGVIFFYADWHEPSKRGGQMHQVFQTLAQRFSSKLNFAMVVAESIPSLSQRYEVSVVPTFVCIGKEGGLYWKLEGANPRELSKNIKGIADDPNSYQVSYNLAMYQLILGLSARVTIISN